MGKKPTSQSALGDQCKCEAWVLRDLIYAFARAARKGHRPREPEMIALMEAAGIPVPETPSRRSSASSSSPVESFFGLCSKVYASFFMVMVALNI